MEIKKGFTLMELMIVVIVIGILASFAIPRFTRTIELSHRQDAESQLIALHAANHIYLAQTGSNFLTGNNLNITQINQGLGINIIANGMTYTYWGNSATTFTATAVRSPSTSFTITVTEAQIAEGTNPSCVPSGPVCDL